jgi:4'-phosphopantetheinyl transferase
MTVVPLSDEIHLYFAYPGQISDPGLLSRYMNLLSDEELAQMSRFHFDRHRHQYLVTRALIRTCLSNYCEVEPAEWRFKKNAYGKPRVAHPFEGLPFRFNISHTDGLIMCGIVRDIAIGVDVEDKDRPTRSGIEKLHGFFSPVEIEELTHLPKEEQKQRFFDYWTLKESYIKARGKGLSLSLSQFSFIFREDKLQDFLVQHDLKDSAKHWKFWRIPMGERYQVAVAIQSERSDFKFNAVNSVPLERNESIQLKFL